MTEAIRVATKRGVGRFNLYDPDFLLLLINLMGTFVLQLWVRSLESPRAGRFRAAGAVVRHGSWRR